MNDGFRRQRALQIVDSMAPFAQAGVIKLDMLAKLVLDQGFGVKDIEKYLNPPEEEAPEQAPPENPSQSSVPAGGMPVPAELPMGGPMPTPDQVAMGAPDTAGLPPELAGLPPELLAQLLAEQEGMAPEQGMQLPPELAQIPGSELIPPEILIQLPPELLQEIVTRGGFTPEVIQVLVESGVLPAPPM
jgi:hypothetical protein